MQLVFSKLSLETAHLLQAPLVFKDPLLLKIEPDFLDSYICYVTYFQVEINSQVQNVPLGLHAVKKTFACISQFLQELNQKSAISLYCEKLAGQTTSLLMGELGGWGLPTCATPQCRAQKKSSVFYCMASLWYFLSYRAGTFMLAC